MTTKEQEMTTYTIFSPITTYVSYEIEAPEGISKKELMDYVAKAKLNLEHEGFTRCEVKDMFSNFMDDTTIEDENGDYLYE